MNAMVRIGAIALGLALIAGCKSTPAPFAAPPSIAAIDGDDPALVCPGAGTHCILNGLAVTGDNLLGASFELQPAIGPAVALAAAVGSTATRALLALPATIAAGTYTLVATNRSGSANQAFTIIQGPPGIQGPVGPDMTPDQLVDAINGASKPLAIGRLPVGNAAGTIAEGNHLHDAAAIVSGTIALQRLPTGTTADTVALGNHTHAQGEVADLPDTIAANTSFGVPMINGITYDPVTDALFYMQYGTWTIGRYDVATRRDTLVWYDGGAGAGEGVAVVPTIVGRDELWFGYSNWAYVRHLPVSRVPADATASGGQAADYPCPAGGFSGLVHAEPWSAVLYTYISVRTDTNDIRFWRPDTAGYNTLQLATTAGGAETTDMNVAVAHTVADGRAGDIRATGLYLDEPTHTIWVGDQTNASIWIFRFDDNIRSKVVLEYPLVVYVGRIRSPTSDPRGLAYDRRRKLVWTCSGEQKRCEAARFDIDAFLAAVPH